MNLSGFMKRVVLVIICLLSAFLPNSLFSQDELPKDFVGIEERLGQKIPLDLELVDESGQTVTLSQLIGQTPAFINFVYYTCPGVCSPFLAEVAKVMKLSQMEPLKEYKVITVSFDATETFKLAHDKKQNYLSLMPDGFPKESWRFLTASQDVISTLTKSVGFSFLPQGKDFVHTTALIAVDPNGKIVRYLFGKTFLPFDLQMAVVEASEGRTGPTINKVLQYCFSYDSEGKRYVFNLLQVLGTFILFCVAIFIVWLIIQNRKRKSELGGDSDVDGN